MLRPEQAERLAPDLLSGDRETVAPVPDAPLPDRIGAYRIVRRIASGGMGTVYEAEQEKPLRRVALKILRPGVSLPKALQRLEHEAEVMAHLHHPGIAQIYHAATWNEGGVATPYFVMEYIPAARWITDYADEHDLTTRQRMELFAQVCDAVHHGHQKGVIHRDLKPANILVDEEGHPKVIDFGVARAIDIDVALTTMRTGVYQLVGTLQYMSPEQCDGNPHALDVRTDVYSLGAVLYELVSGHPPYDLSETTVPNATRRIQEEEPPPLGTIDRALQGDVETIVAKALEKSKERRYASANDLARDARRYLRNEPIEARPPTAWTKLVRLLARHPVWATASASVAIVVLTGLLTWLSTSWLVKYKPQSLWTSADSSEARLLSTAGREIRKWSATDPGGLTLAELVERPAEMGGGRAVVIARRKQDDGRLPGSVTVYDVGAWSAKFSWTAGVAEAHTPAQFRSRGLSADGFGAAGAWMADVFPERDGQEIVVAFHYSPGSAAALYVYTLDGEILYRMWHDGGFAALWVPEHGTMVLAGQSSEAYWEDRGSSSVRAAHPWVVFAIRPTLGQLQTEWTTADANSNPDLLWYRALLPPEATDLFNDHLLKRPVAEDSSRGIFRWTLFLAEDRDRGAAVSCLFDEHGTEIDGERIMTDEWSLWPTPPEPEEFFFGPLPPILAP